MALTGWFADLCADLSAELPPEARASLNFGVALGLRIFNTGRTVQVGRRHKAAQAQVAGCISVITAAAPYQQCKTAPAQVEWDDLDGSNASVPILGTGWASIYDPAALYSTPTGPPPKLFQIPFKPFQIHWHSACEHVMDGAWMAGCAALARWGGVCRVALPSA